MPSREPVKEKCRKVPPVENDDGDGDDDEDDDDEEEEE